MATMAVTPTTNANLKPQTQDWGLQLITKDIADGKKDYSVKAIQGDKEIQKAETEGSLLMKQTFGFDFPANDEGQRDVIPDAEERNDVFIAGLKASRIGPRIRRALEEWDEKDENGMPILKFQQVEGVFDFREELQKEARRKNLTPEEKALKNLRNIPVFAHMTDDQLRVFLGNAAVMAGANATEEENTASDSEAEADANAETATA